MYIESVSNLFEYTNKLNLNEKDYLMILVAEKSKNTVEEILLSFKQRKIKFFGGIFPKVIYKTEVFEEGYIVQKLPIIGAVNLIDMKKDNINEYRNMNEEEIKDKTAIVLVDGFSNHIQKFLRNLFKEYTTNLNYIGGGAGSEEFKQTPCIFSEEGLFEDVAVVAILESEMEFKVQHGLEKAIGPIIATGIEGNNLIEINWEKAFEFYKKILKNNFDIELTEQNFLEIASIYPFGIKKNENNEFIVREPVGLNEWEIKFTTDIPQNIPMYILTGDINKLLNAANEVAEKLKEIRKKENKTILFSCVSRNTYLKENFKIELSNMQEKIDSNLEGCLVIGEIASCNNGFLEYFNKTIVLGVF